MVAWNGLLSGAEVVGTLSMAYITERERENTMMTSHDNHKNTIKQPAKGGVAKGGVARFSLYK